MAFVLGEFVIERLKHAIPPRCGIQSTIDDDGAPKDVTLDIIQVLRTTYQITNLNEK